MAAQWFYTSDTSFTQDFPTFLRKRQQSARDIAPLVTTIIEAVQSRGDAALCEYTAKWDHLSLTPATLRVSAAEVDAAVAECPAPVLAALELAAERIRTYHQYQLPEDKQYQDAEGNLLGWQWKAIRAAGLYVPGGKAAYPSSVLMNAIPAKVAGVKRLAMVVPAPEGYLNPAVLAAAKLAEVDEIYRIGGAQAVAALAYGTPTIVPVDKIVGPGNAFVAEAKRQVFGTVGIDMIAGPSEICVLADSQNHPDWIAADILSQAEHDTDAQSILIVADKAFAEAVCAAIEVILETLPRAAIARKSWEENGAIVVLSHMAEAAEVIDIIAPEHLELAIENPEALAKQIACAGAIFMGRHTPEAFGDYVAGPSHVLPTNGTARFSSGLSVYDFLVRQSLIGATAAGFQKAGQAAAILADAEGLHAHALSLRCRLT